MQKVSIKTSVGNVVQFNPNVPKQVKPSVATEYIEDGERFYSLTDGRVFKADMYDRTFGVAVVSGPIKPRGTREPLKYMKKN